MDDQQRIMSMMVLAEDQQKAAQAAIDDLKAQQAKLSDLAHEVRREAARGASAAATKAMADATKDAIQALADGAGALRIATNDTKTAAEAFPDTAVRVGWRICLIALLASILAVLAVFGTAFSSLAWQRNQVDVLRQERAALLDEVASLKANAQKWAAKAGKAKLTTCGNSDEKGRLCVQIDRDAGVFGNARDYAVLKGY